MQGGWVAAEHSGAARISPAQSGPGSTPGKTARHGVEGWAAETLSSRGPGEEAGAVAWAFRRETPCATETQDAWIPSPAALKTQLDEDTV